MRIAINLIEGLVLLFASWKGIEFYTGRTNYTGEKEVKRKKIIEKFGWLFILAIAITAISGIGLILSTLFRLA